MYIILSHISKTKQTCKHFILFLFTIIPSPCTVRHVAELRHQLLVLAALSAGNEALESGRVRIPVHVHEERRRHEVRRLLRLLVQDVVIGVSDQRPEIRMEEHLIWDL